MIIASDRPIDDRTHLLGDEAVVKPLPGRLRHHALLLKSESKSSRFKEAAARFAKYPLSK